MQLPQGGTLLHGVSCAGAVWVGYTNTVSGGGGYTLHVTPPLKNGAMYVVRKAYPTSLLLLAAQLLQA